MMRAEILDIRVLRHLRMATTSLTSAQLADLVYADDPDGGPITGDAAVRLSIGRLVLEGHRIVSKTGRAGGYVYVGYDDPEKITIKTIRERRGQVKALSDRGLTIPRIAGRLGLPTTAVEADLADLERGLDFDRVSRIHSRRTA